MQLGAVHFANYAFGKHRDNDGTTVDYFRTRQEAVEVANADVIRRDVIPIQGFWQPLILVQSNQQKRHSRCWW